MHYGHIAHVEDGFAIHGDREHFGLQAAALADLARYLAHVGLVVFTHGLRVGFVVAAHQRAHHALKAGGVFAQATPTVAVGDVDFEVMAVEDVVLDVGRQILPRGLHREAHFLGQTFKDVAVVLGGHLGAAPRLNDTVGQGFIRVGDHELRVDFEFEAETGAGRAGAVGGVEGERARFDLIEFEHMTIRTAAVFGERAAARGAAFLLVHEVDDDAAVGELQRGFHRVGQALSDAVLDHKSVDHHFDGVLLLLGEFDVVGQLLHFAVDERAGITVGAQQFKHIHELALAALDHGSKNLESRAFRVIEQGVDDLLRGLGCDRLAAFRAVRNTGAGE